MKKILVVEDEADVRENIREVLESEEYCVITAKDGQEGYETALQENPDMILSDIKMPNLNGIQMLKLLREESAFKNTPFLFLSAKVDLTDIRQGMSSGADDYITKPFSIQDLLNAVEMRFKKKEVMFQEMDEVRESLIRRIPHELRTPLIGILGFSELLSDNIDAFSKKDIIEMMKNINKTGKRLHSTIEKFLYYAELLAFDCDNTAKIKVLENSYEVEQVLENYHLSNILNKSDRFEDIRINMESAVIAISEVDFNCILRELLDNAMKFSDEGSLIHLTAKIVKGKYEITIEDVGIGMPQETLANIKTFRQFEPNQYQYTGVGLGLAIVKKIVELTNSFMTITSKKGAGTSVKIAIPLV